MDENDSVISELDSEQANAIDSVIGKKIWNIEVLEEGDQSMVKIMFSEDEETDFILLHAEGMDMYIVNAKPKVTH
jgi:hypothetical protein